MRCNNCKSENLFGDINVRILLPLAKKGGNILTAGYVVTQKMVMAWWLEEGGADRLMLGPILCADCTEEHTYFKGLTPALRRVPYAEAVRYGYDHYAASKPPEGGDAEEETE